MKFILPYPPSANRYWRNVKGRTILSKEARQYKIDVAAIAATSIPLQGDIFINLDIYRPQKSGDLDGRIKQLLDALQGFAYDDDKQITRIVATRYDDKNNPRAEVVVGIIMDLDEV